MGVEGGSEEGRGFEHADQTYREERWKVPTAGAPKDEAGAGGRDACFRKGWQRRDEGRSGRLPGPGLRCSVSVPGSKRAACTGVAREEQCKGVSGGTAWDARARTLSMGTNESVARVSEACMWMIITLRQGPRHHRVGVAGPVVWG